MHVLEDFAEYVTGARYSLNRGERLNIDKSLIDMFKACNSIAFLHFLLTIVGRGYIFLSSVLSFSEPIMHLLYCSSYLAFWMFFSQWYIPKCS